MVDTDSEARTPPAAGNRAARYAFVLLLGLVIGAIATVMIVRALEARKDHYPDAVMHVMAAHVAALKRNVAGNRCAATDTLPHLQTLRQLSNDLEPAFGELGRETNFTRHASGLRASLDSTLASPPLNCQGVQAALAKIGESCQNCHNEFNK